MEINTFQLGELGTNCYLITKNNSCFIVDPADNPKTILKNIANLKLEFILLTHGHFDHLLAIERLHKTYPNKPIYIGEDDKELLSELSQQSHYSSKELKDINIAIKIVDKDSKITFEGEKIKVIETPGHSHGSVCYLIDGNLFSGDTLFYHTIGRTDFWTGDPIAMQSSLQKLAKLPKETKIYPGHGRSTTIKEELINGYLARI